MKGEHEYKYPSSHLSGFGCVRPQKYIEIHESGDVTACCFLWLPERCGNLLTDSWEEILNNSTRLEIINGMRNGKFDKCNDHCPLLSSKLEGIDNEDAIELYISPLDQYDQRVSQLPYTINFSYDVSCNLQCPSCRNEFQFFKIGESTKLDKIHNEVKKFVDHLISIGESIELNITGSGDAFASPTYWNYLKELSTKELSDKVKISLMTNGIAMTKERWEEIKPLWKNIRNIKISIDAATQETYSIVRKNGNINKLTENLVYLDEIKKNNLLPNSIWYTNFTVQKANHHEIKKFVDWQTRFDTIAGIFFSVVGRWDHMSDSQFESMRLGNEEYRNLAKILTDETFYNPKVKLGNLHSIRNSTNRLT